MHRKPLRLKADPNCRICKGRGSFIENHGDGMCEVMDCECVFVNAPDDEESQAAIDRGDYEIISSRPADNHDHGRYW